MPDQADGDQANRDAAGDEVFNLYEAKTHLSRLVDRAAAGDTIVIARQGRPVVRLVPVSAPRPPAEPTLADIHDRLAAIEHAVGIPPVIAAASASMAEPSATAC